MYNTVPITSTADLISFQTSLKVPGNSSITYKIHLKPDAKTATHHPQKCPIIVYKQVKSKLDWMVKLEDITPIVTLIILVSSLAYLWKGNRKLCLKI